MFQKALEDAIKRLTDARRRGLLLNFALIGGLALSRWTKPRATDDIDITICMGGRETARLADFLGGKLRKGGASDPLEATITFHQHDDRAPVEVQLVQFPPAIEAVAFHQIDEIDTGAVTVPIVDWKALLLLKLYAGGQQDLLDAASIVAAVSPSKAETRYLEGKARALRLDRRLKKVLAD